ncbi:hypothetical protein, partial [Hydrogenoanaerobacterium sp.]|uniref:hypothetical protein n=1 Tax=Hydrogenoanaerobacterium sp. TaxID=2953763 RepID=UPI00289AA515
LPQQQKKITIRISIQQQLLLPKKPFDIRKFLLNLISSHTMPAVKKVLQQLKNLRLIFWNKALK